MKEFELISKLLRPLAGPDSGGLADDCAHFEGFVVTKDMLASGVHFFADDAPFDLARKALRVNLSDLASCGAEPFGFLMALALPKNTPEQWLREFTRGLQADITEFNFQLLGGDTVVHDAPLVISVTALGKTPAPIKRSGAKAGNNIFVSGKIGEGYIGLQAKSRHPERKRRIPAELPPTSRSFGFAQDDGYFIGRYELPQPRIALGMRLRGIATACIDISDGLLADLGHICTESGVGAEIYAAQIPVPEGSYNLLELISGGDDYELCFTSPLEEFPGCYKIGKIIAGSGLKLDGRECGALGFEH